MSQPYQLNYQAPPPAEPPSNLKVPEGGIRCQYFHTGTMSTKTVGSSGNTLALRYIVWKTICRGYFTPDNIRVHVQSQNIGGGFQHHLPTTAYMQLIMNGCMASRLIIKEVSFELNFSPVRISVMLYVESLDKTLTVIHAYDRSALLAMAAELQISV